MFEHTHKPDLSDTFDGLTAVELPPPETGKRVFWRCPDCKLIFVLRFSDPDGFTVCACCGALWSVSASGDVRPWAADT